MKKPVLYSVIGVSVILVIGIVLVLWLVVFKKLASQKQTPFNQKLYVGYIPAPNMPNMKNTIFFDINFTQNQVASLTAGYSVDRVSPIEGNVNDDKFVCIFQEIVKNVPYRCSFVKEGNLYHVNITKTDLIQPPPIQNNSLGDPSPTPSQLPGINLEAEPFEISDAGFIYNTFIYRKQPNIFGPVQNQRTFIGYIGSNVIDYLNVIFFELNFTENKISTLAFLGEPNLYDGVEGVFVNGSLAQNSFNVTFLNSFLGPINAAFTTTIDNTNVYNVVMTFPDRQPSIEPLSFVVQNADINDMAKTYATLLESTKIMSLPRLVAAKKAGLFKGMPNRGHKARALKFVNQSLEATNTREDFKAKADMIGKIKVSLATEYNKRMSANKTQKEKNLMNLK